MAELVVVCRRCNKEHPAQESRNGRCLDCSVRLACDSMRGEYLRLLRKIERLKSRGYPYRSTLEQLQRQQVRLVRIVQEYALDERGQQLYEGVIKDFEGSRQRIIVPAS